MVNVTLSADEELLARAQAYAQARNTTLNELLRDYLRRLTEQMGPEQAADEFATIARNRSGRSPDDFVFNRHAAHGRPAGDP